MNDTNLSIENDEDSSQDVTYLSEQLSVKVNLNQDDEVEAVVPTEQSSQPAENKTAEKCKLS